MPPADKAFYSNSQDMRISLVILTMLASFPLVAQQRYTDLLQRSVEGQGKITLYQQAGGSRSPSSLQSHTSPTRPTPQWLL